MEQPEPTLPCSDGICALLIASLNYTNCWVSFSKEDTQTPFLYVNKVMHEQVKIFIQEDSSFQDIIQSYVTLKLYQNRVNDIWKQIAQCQRKEASVQDITNILSLFNELFNIFEHNPIIYFSEKEDFNEADLQYKKIKTSWEDTITSKGEEGVNPSKTLKEIIEMVFDKLRECSPSHQLKKDDLQWVFFKVKQGQLEPLSLSLKPFIKNERSGNIFQILQSFHEDCPMDSIYEFLMLRQTLKKIEKIHQTYQRKYPEKDIGIGERVMVFFPQTFIDQQWESEILAHDDHTTTLPITIQPQLMSLQASNNDASADLEISLDWNTLDKLIVTALSVASQSDRQCQEATHQDPQNKETTPLLQPPPRQERRKMKQLQ